MLHYDNAMELRRRPWQRRIEVYSPKIQRRLTLFSRDAHDAWLLLEADPVVRTFCERPAYVAGEAGRLIDFWVDRGRHAKFWILGGRKDEEAGLPATLHGVAVRIIHRADMIAAEMRVRNWSQIIPYLISFKRHAIGGSRKRFSLEWRSPIVSNTWRRHSSRSMSVSCVRPSLSSLRKGESSFPISMWCHWGRPRYSGDLRRETTMR